MLLVVASYLIKLKLAPGVENASSTGCFNLTYFKQLPCKIGLKCAVDILYIRDNVLKKPKQRCLSGERENEQQSLDLKGGRLCLANQTVN